MKVCQLPILSSGWGPAHGRPRPAANGEGFTLARFPFSWISLPGQAKNVPSLDREGRAGLAPLVCPLAPTLLTPDGAPDGTVNVTAALARRVPLTLAAAVPS